MSRPKLTPWFDSTTKPKRQGVYQTRIPNISGGDTYQRWDGGSWTCFSWTVEHAALPANANVKSSYQFVQWRGLAADPVKQVMP